jgi:RHS repeat-associated protein
MAPKNKPLYRRILLIVTLIFLPLFGLLVFLMPSPVEATAYYPTGDVVKIFPPESVLRDAFESDDFAYVFDEQQNITLTQSLILNDLCQGSCTLPVGTLINSHFIHADSVNEGSVTWYAGSVSFDTEVLGIIKTTSSLDSTDERFGVEETTYAGNETDRGLENGQDTVTLSSDRRTITISFGTLDKQDQIRVITQGGPSLPDPMIWNTDPDCPFCTANQAIAAAGGPINTRNGNLSYSATDLTIPVLGQALTLRRSYASQAIDTYTTTLGYGWSHHFDMRLRFSYPGIENAIALQSPGGNLLPFYVITSTPGITTYLPYPGVTASLEQITTTYVVTAFNQMTYVFNPQGQLIRQTDAQGNHLFFTYDNQGRLQRVYQGERALIYTYDNNDRLLEVEDNISRTVTFGYSPIGGDLMTVTLTAPDASLLLTTTYQYSGTTHLLTHVIDPSGRVVEQTAYDNQGRAYQQWDGEGNLLVDMDYSLANSPVVTENGIVMTHTYDSRGTLSQVSYACASVTPGCGTSQLSGYDVRFKPIVGVDANDNRTRLLWDETGSSLEAMRDPLKHETYFSYNDLNSLAEIENARGYTTSYSYEDGNLPTFRTSTTDALQQTTIYTPTAEGLLEAERDPNGLVSRYWYNEYGQVTQTVRAYGTSDAITMTYGYDAVGRLITTTQVSPESDPITSLSVYDAANRLITTLQNWTGTNPATWENECVTTTGPRDTNVCTRYGYDAAGRTISTTNTLEQTDLSFYDAAGRLYLRVGNYDGTANYENDPVGVLCDWVTPDPENNLCSLTGYDSYGRVISTTNVLGNVDHTFYDSLGRVQATVVNSVNVTDDWEECDFPSATADEDLCTVYTYDAAGNVVEVKDPVGRVTLTVYDELNRVEGMIVNWDGDIDLNDCYTSTWLNQTERDENVCTRYVYDEVGNTTIVSDTLGRMTYTVYDELNRVAGTIGNWDGTIDLDDCWTGSLPANRDNNVCSGYVYDAAGNQTVVTNTLGQMNLTVYDTAQRPIIQVTNWDGTSTTWPDDCADTVSEPEATENLCTFTSYDSLGRRADMTNALGHMVEFAYDGLGRVITTTRYLDNQPIETTVTYDALGNRLNQTDAEDHTFSTVYDSLNRPLVSISHEGVAITTTYNAASWVMGTINNLEHTTANDYDDLGRLVVMTDGENHTTEYGYDALGNQIVMTDALGIATSYSYDELNRLISVTENETTNRPDHENNLFTQYRYDVLGNRVVITNALAITSSLTVYDTLNRPVSVKDALGNETQYQYNILGQRTVMTDANGDITLYSYDDLNRLDTVSYETDNETVEYAYNALGNRTIMTDSLGVATYEYDDFSRVITVTSPLTGTVVYGYDNVGNRVELTYPNGYTVTYQYDGDNRLVEVEDWQEGITTYEYDPAGRLVTTTLPNDVVTVNSYDDAHRLTNLAHEDGDSNLVARYTYALDDVGNRVVATETLRLPFQVTTETQTSPTDLSLTSYQHPAVAYNSEDDEYMVIWQAYDSSSSTWYLYGQRVGPSGALIGDDFEIAAGATEPAIAYSPGAGLYLVVWRDADDYIQGVYVDVDGSIPAEAFIIYDVDINSQPDVANNPNDGTFTVVWLYENGEKYGINAFKVQEQGTVVEVAGEQVALAHPAIAISSNGTQLVVWEMEDTTYALFDIKGQRLNSSGSLLGTILTLANDANHNETTPAIAWNDSASNFLVTWRDTVSSLGDTDYAIEARRVGTDGSLPGSIVTLHSGMGNLAASPDLTVSGGDWLVAWQQNASDRALYGRWVQSNGTLGDETLALITAASNQAHPALAEGSDAGGMLLVWEDDRDSEDTIYHAIITPIHLETAVIDYTYDPLYRLVEADYSGAISANYLYVYDEVGNMTAYTETVGTELVRVTRSFDEANQLQTSTMLDGPQLGTTSYYYNDNSNLNQILPPGVDPNEAGDQRYYYNQRNLLITSTVRGDSGWDDQATFTYDGLGNRVQQIDLTGSTPITTTYANDNLGLSQVLVAYSGSEETSNLFGLDLILQDTGADTLTLLTDGLGSVRLEMVEDAIKTTTTHDPYGNQLVQTGTSNTTYSFTGEQEDSSTGLLYLRARYYDANLRTFLSRDRRQGDVKQPDTLPSHLYVGNNPINQIDPTGLWYWRVPGGGVSPGHAFVEVAYELRGNINVPGFNPNRQIEYTIPRSGRRRPDMFNSLTGAVFEVEPIYLMNSPSHGQNQAQQYVTLLKNAANSNSLSGYFTRLGPPEFFNWGSASYRLGVGLDWGQQLRISPYPLLPAFDFVADYAKSGLVVFWLEPNAISIVDPNVKTTMSQN